MINCLYIFLKRMMIVIISNSVFITRVKFLIKI